METLLGAEWRFVQKVDRLGLLGCLPLVVAAWCLVAGGWHWLWYTVPVVVASWLPYVILKRGRRYRTAERQAFEHERAQPHFFFELTPAPEERLPGGFLRV